MKEIRTWHVQLTNDKSRCNEVERGWRMATCKQEKIMEDRQGGGHKRRKERDRERVRERDRKERGGGRDRKKRKKK